jgi:hypothetical protein
LKKATRWYNEEWIVSSINHVEKTGISAKNEIRSL